MTAALSLDNLISYCLQIAVLVMIGASLLALFRLSIPNVRLKYWQLMLVGCLSLPVIQPWQPSVGDPSAHVSVETSGVKAIVSTPSATGLSLAEAVLLVLAVGVAARLAWLGLGLFRLRGYRLKSQLLSPLPTSVEETQSLIGVRPGIRLSENARGPVTFGLWHPVVVLPARFSEMDPDIQAAITAHELLHVRRSDWIFTLFEEVVRSLLWFHPAIWWLLGQIQLSREQTVDREVVRLTSTPGQYVEALLAMAGSHGDLGLVPAPTFLRRRHLQKRVTAVLKEISMTKRRLILSLVTMCALVAGSVWVTAQWFPLQAAPQASSATTSGPIATIDQGGTSLLHRSPIEYPREAIEEGVAGKVVLEVSVNEKGTIDDARVLSGPAALRRPALQGVLTWHYSSEMSLPAKVPVTISFLLPDSSQRPAPGHGPAARTAPHVESLMPVLGRIVIDGLPEAARERLLSSLPIREGERVSPDSMKLIRRAARDVDEHLVVTLTPDLGKQSPTLVISLPSEMITSASGSQEDTSLMSRRIRVRGVVMRTHLVRRVTPVYPEMAKEAGIQGNVEMVAIIAEDGKVRKLDVTEGPAMLIPAALKAVKEWEYKPVLLNGEPVEAVTEIVVNFSLAP